MLDDAVSSLLCFGKHLLEHLTVMRPSALSPVLAIRATAPAAPERAAEMPTLCSGRLSGLGSSLAGEAGVLLAGVVL